MFHTTVQDTCPRVNIDIGLTICLTTSDMVTIVEPLSVVMYSNNTPFEINLQMT